MNNPLHIVCLDAPSLPNYGGAIDMYYKIVELSKSRDIILHYFDYKKDRSASGLEPFCKAIHSYKRGSLFNSLFSAKPYIVGSRINKALIAKLHEDAHPILVEGIHCAGILPYLQSHRKVVIRMHNDEAEYYRQLAKSESYALKRLFHLLESKRLNTYQQQLKKDFPLACVSSTDMEVLKRKYNFSNLHFIPSFTSWQNLSGKEGYGKYCLYQGNLQVAENQQMAAWLIKHVFSKIDVPFYIAGKGINKHLQSLAKPYSNVTLRNNPTDEVMNGLVKEAHINVLPSLNNTGLKFKMLHALFQGRHCITNDAGIAGTAFSQAVHLANIPQEFIDRIQQLFKKPFTLDDLQQRTEIATVYNNKENAAKLNALL
ncbi:MAG: glycosyltransferase family 4 protein [Flaviaesturariibacter sp.]|nr:glycosyltransferase family 4 protein [Flaviaesturariibacter sp.]